MPVKLPFKNKGRSFWVVPFFIVFLTFLSTANSQSETVQDEPVKTEVAKDPSKWALGVGTGWLHDYPGAGQGRIRFLPFPVYRGSFFRVDRITGVSGEVYNDSKLDFSWNFIFQFPTDSDSIPVRRGMPNLDWLLSLGPQVEYNFLQTQHHKFFFRFPIRANTCTNFADRTRFCGIAFSPGVRHSIWYKNVGEFTIRAEAFWYSSEYSQYYYEVQSEYVTPLRQAYHAQAGFLGFVYGLFHSIPFDGWELSSSASVYDYNMNVNQDSPLFVLKTNFAVFFGVVIDI